jgi:hypothetical protein
MNRFERITTFERGAIDLKTGEFPMTLASEGEASDGDILSIRGGIIPNRMPLLQSHINDPSKALGSVLNPRKVLREAVPVLKATGKIELEGDTPLAEIRRDVAMMIDKGHINGASLRWEAIKFTRRVNLPKDHPAHVTEDEQDPRKRYGVLFERWQAQEGSVVAVGSDPKALIGRSDETQGAVREFWRAMADGVERNDIADPREALYQITQAVDAAKAVGFKWGDLVNAIWSASGFGEDADNLREVKLENGRSLFLPVEALEELLRGELEAKDTLIAALQASEKTQVLIVPELGDDSEGASQTDERGAPGLTPSEPKGTVKTKPRVDTAQLLSKMLERQFGNRDPNVRKLMLKMVGRAFPGRI